MLKKLKIFFLKLISKMHPTFRLFARLAALLLVILFVNIIFNKFCNFTHSCQPYYLSYLMPRQAGEMPINVTLQISSDYEDLDITILKPVTTTYSNQFIKVPYVLKNNSDQKIKFQPMFLVTPQNLAQYIVKYQCLCSQEISINPGETQHLQSVFLLDKSIENDEIYDNLNALSNEFFDNNSTELSKGITLRYIF